MQSAGSIMGIANDCVMKERIMKQLPIFILLMLTMLSCRQRHESYPISSNYPISATLDSYLDIESVTLDSVIATSLIGKLDIVKDKLCFIDYLYCYMYFISETGQLENRELGIGNGPKEINCGAIATYSFFDDGSISFYGNSDDVYLYSSDYVIKKDNSFRVRRDYGKMSENADKDPCSFESYTFPRFIVCRSYNEKTYINNNSSAYGFNYFETPEEYAKECRIITEYDIPNKRIGRLLGRGLPEIYHGTSDKNYIFSEFTFDIDNEGSFYVAFMADSLIYKFNQDFKPMEAFGYQGKDMDMDYLSVTNPKEIYTKANEQYESKGWYTWVEYIQEKDWVCRSYHKGGDSSSDGMQIYEDGKLIADLDVPVGFRPIGYIYPYIYSDIMTEGNSQVFYKINVE